MLCAANMPAIGDLFDLFQIRSSRRLRGWQCLRHAAALVTFVTGARRARTRRRPVRLSVRRFESVGHALASLWPIVSVHSRAVSMPAGVPHAGVCQRRTDPPPLSALARMHNGHPVAYFDGPGRDAGPRRVIDAMTEYLCSTTRTPTGRFPAARKRPALSRRAVALATGRGSADEIVFGANMTTLRCISAVRSARLAAGMLWS